MELLEKGKTAKNLKEEYIKEFSKNFQQVNKYYNVSDKK